MTAYERLVAALEIRGTVKGAGQGRVVAQCPAHPDDSPSLSVRAIEGSVLLYCHADCKTRDVLAALDLTPADLYDGRRAEYRYDSGRVVHRGYDHAGRKRFRQSGDLRSVELYHLAQLHQAGPGAVYLVEGEKDVHAIEAIGGVATTAPMGAANIGKCDLAPLHGRDVVAIADRDLPGLAWAQQVRELLGDRAASLRFGQAAAGNDPADHITAGHGLGDWVPLDLGPTGDAWPEPTPVGRAVDLPPFPVDVFPGWLADQVKAVAGFTQTDPAMPGAVALTVLSACAGGRLEVEARPGWREPTNLFLAVIAAPGERKSPVQTVMTRPLRDAEAGLARAAAGSIAEQQTLRDIAAAHAEKLKTAAAKAAGEKRTDLEAEAIEAAKQAEAVTVPTLPRLFADDVTPEALASLMAANDGRMAIISDEGGIFDTLAGRYSTTPNLDPFLKGYSGTPMRIDRKGREPEFVDKPALTVGLMAQPAVLRKVGGNDVFKGRGLVGRFLFVLPVSKVGARLVDPDPVHPDTAALYAAQVHTMARTLAEWSDPAVTTLTPDAYQVLLKAMQAIEDQLGPGGKLDHIADWATKLAGGIVRMAGLLHLAHHPEDAWRLPVEADTMTASVRLADALTAHYIAATEAIGLDPTTENARYLLDVIRRFGREEFTVRELAMAVTRSRFPKVADLAEPLALLVDHDWIAPKEAAERTGPGRKPSPKYTVNPAAESTEST